VGLFICREYDSFIFSLQKEEGCIVIINLFLIFKSHENEQKYKFSYFQYVNFLYNLNGEVVNQNRRVYNRTTKLIEEQQTPKICNTYNHKHNFVDSLKSRIARSQFILRARRGWRVKLHAMIYVLLHNSFVWYKSVKKINNKKYTFRTYITEIIHQLQSLSTPPKTTITSPQSSAMQTLTLHNPSLSKSSTESRVKCRYSKCNTRTRKRCDHCQIALCSQQCSLSYHNPFISFVSHI